MNDYISGPDTSRQFEENRLNTATLLSAIKGKQIGVFIYLPQPTSVIAVKDTTSRPIACRVDGLVAIVSPIAEISTDRTFALSQAFATTATHKYVTHRRPEGCADDETLVGEGDHLTMCDRETLYSWSDVYFRREDIDCLIAPDDSKGIVTKQDERPSPKPPLVTTKAISNAFPCPNGVRHERWKNGTYLSEPPGWAQQARKRSGSRGVSGLWDPAEFAYYMVCEGHITTKEQATDIISEKFLAWSDEWEKKWEYLIDQFTGIVSR